MKVGILGYARAGKTTIFNALTEANAPVGAFGSRDANLAVLKVPDSRVVQLAEMYSPKKITYAEFQFVDLAPNESAGDEKALDGAALAELKNVEALVHVVRCFDNPEVMHPLGSVDAVRDCRAMDDELLLSDMEIIEKRVARLEKENKKEAEYQVLQRCMAGIEAGTPIRAMELSEQEAREIAGYGFLSQKPIMLVGNYGEESIGEDDPTGLETYAAENGLTLVALCGAIEMEIAELSEEDAEAFRADLGLGEQSRTRFLQSAYDMLGLMSFLTAGEPEVRAWTIRKGTKAVDAAGVIHSDIQRGFIRAEIAPYDGLVAAGSMPKLKEQGSVRLEGKEYIMQDGDVVLFRFNV